MRLPKWERLPEALQRVMGTSVSEKQAKRDLCNALADRKIRLRLCFMWRPTSQDFLARRGLPTTNVHRVTNDEIPGILKPSDFDWRRSRIRKPGLWHNIRGPSGSFFGNWRLVESAHYASGDPIPHSQRGGRSLAYQHRIELLRADVIKAFNIVKEQVTAVPQSKSGARTNARETVEHVPAAPQPKSGAGAKTRGVKQAIIAVFPPYGIPPLGLSAKGRDTKIKEWLDRAGYSLPMSDSALAKLIQRVLKSFDRK
jgi:hypothetical protein